MDSDPSDEELKSFVGSLLSNLDRLLTEPGVIEETISEHREIWVMLYKASLQFDDQAHGSR